LLVCDNQDDRAISKAWTKNNGNLYPEQADRHTWQFGLRKRAGNQSGSVQKQKRIPTIQLKSFFM
jgi:hypothetical protein